MFFRDIFLIASFGYAGAVGTVGASHNRIDAVGRNRANVVHNPTKTATQPEIMQPIIQPAAPVTDDTETIEIITPTSTPQPEPTPDLTPDIEAATEYVERLKNEIAQIDSEIARCKKAKTNWTIGTVVGSVGVVGTATGAIVQAVQINKAKKNGATESATDSDKDNKESE